MIGHRIRVLIVDDSSFFRRQISRILETDPLIEIAGSAKDGREALEKAAELKPDVITMDVEMPVMDGIKAVKELMRTNPTPVLMFSSLTVEGARATLDALDAGAVDFIPKKFEDIARDKEGITKALCERVKAIGGSAGTAVSRKKAGTRPATAVPKSEPAPSSAPAPRASREKKPIDLLAIGTSTGGPLALQKILVELPNTYPVPILLIQHMPATFTNAFAQRLNQLCKIKVVEAEDGMVLEKGVAYLAPGGKQMTVKKRGDSARIIISDSTEDQTYKPCIDITFESLAENYQANVLAVVLTGMGRDGTEGAKKMVQRGAVIWAQDEATSVVFGMPHAIIEAELASKILPLEEFAQNLNRYVS